MVSKSTVAEQLLHVSRSTPASSRCVAKRCRSVCGVDRAWSGRRAARVRWHMRCTVPPCSGRSALHAREQPSRRPIRPPVGAQFRPAARRQRHQPILVPLALADVHDHAGAVDVGRPAGAAVRAGAGRRRRPTCKQHAVAAGRGRVEQLRNTSSGVSTPGNGWAACRRGGARMTCGAASVTRKGSARRRRSG